MHWALPYNQSFIIFVYVFIIRMLLVQSPDLEACMNVTIQS